MLWQARRVAKILGPSLGFEALKAKLAGQPGLVSVQSPELKHPAWIRLRSSDVSTFNQVIKQREYAMDVHRAPRTIIDAGANVGLAAAYFASRFPDAKIVAVEPELGNFEILKLNARPYPNVVPVLGALWHESGTIQVRDQQLGSWGFATYAADQPSDAAHVKLSEVRSYTVDELMRLNGIDRLDLLKIDIEGSEREVFEHCSKWINDVECIVAELHERMRTGANRAFYSATSGFAAEYFNGKESSSVYRPSSFAKIPASAVPIAPAAVMAG